MRNESKRLVHDLYNNLVQSNTGKEMEDIKEVLLKVYKRLNDSKENPPLINRLINFIYFKAFTEKLTFSEEQDELIRQLSGIGQKAGLNGSYRANYGDKSQF